MGERNRIPICMLLAIATNSALIIGRISAGTRQAKSRMLIVGGDEPHKIVHFWTRDIHSINEGIDGGRLAAAVVAVNKATSALNDNICEIVQKVAELDQVGCIGQRHFGRPCEY